LLDRYTLLTSLGKGLLKFGAPSHRIEKMLTAVAGALRINSTFIYFPGIILLTVKDSDSRRNWTFSPIRLPEGVDLSKLPRLHLIYRKLVYGSISTADANRALRDLVNAHAVYPKWFRYIIAYVLGFTICPLAFGGSFSDMVVAGAASCAVASIPFHVRRKKLAVG
jgi:uncharacterized membrane protein YjjP (DUF1212 family)